SWTRTDDSAPALGQIDGSRGVAVYGDGVGLSSRGSIVRLNLCSWTGQQVGKTQDAIFAGGGKSFLGCLWIAGKANLLGTQVSIASTSLPVQIKITGTLERGLERGGVNYVTLRWSKKMHLHRVPDRK